MLYSIRIDRVDGEDCREEWAVPTLPFLCPLPWKTEVSS
jgi:hypothetical protein